MVEETFPSGELPEWTWNNAVWWIGVSGTCGTFLGLLLFITPILSSYSILVRILIVIFFALALPFLLLVLIFVIKIIFVWYERIINYTDVRQKFDDKLIELSTANELLVSLSRQLTAGRLIEISKIIYYKENAYLVIKKVDGLNLKVGDILTALDIDDRMVMGTFSVSEIRSSEYHAKNINLGSVWLGFIKQQNLTEFSSPPGTVAVLTLKEGETNG